MRWLREVRFWACVAVACTTHLASASADDATTADAATAEVRAAAREYAAAVRRGDTDVLLKSWTNDGDYVDATGRSYRARDLIRKMVDKPSREKTADDAAPSKSSLRFVTPDVAIEDGDYDCGKASDGSAMTGHFTAVWVKRDGRWLLDGLRESATPSSRRDERLKPLEWLLGEWVGQTEDSVMIVSARISDRGNYIIRDFAVLGDGGEATATERIAWDPERGEFRSWTFDSQDGRGEGRWKRNGDHWLVETKETMADGTSAFTTAVLTRQGEKELLWEVKSSKVGGQVVPPRRVKFTRAPEGD
jgi:uncharacterized protein (TIGR02246 family)